MAKVLWSVDCFIQLFLKDCRKCSDCEDVDQRVINVDDLNMDVILYCLHTIPPPHFHKNNNKPKENEDPKVGTRNGKWG